MDTTSNELTARISLMQANTFIEKAEKLEECVYRTTLEMLALDEASLAMRIATDFSYNNCILYAEASAMIGYIYFRVKTPS